MPYDDEVRESDDSAGWPEEHEAADAGPTGTHPAAVWGFVLALLPLGITQLVAIPLAIVALVKINESRGRRGGQGLAIAALVLAPLAVLGVCFVAMIAAIAIPGLSRSRVGTNESSAIGALRSLATSQAQFQSQCIVDQDADGVGEFGTLGELAGTSPCRVSGQQMNATPFIAAILGVCDQNGVAQKSGYHFVVYLPTAKGPARRESGGTFGAATLDAVDADANAQEVRWCAYAWPAMPGQSGNRVFFVNQAGDVYTSPATITRYGGASGAPRPDAAFDVNGTAPDNLDAEVGMAAAGLQAGDGNVWVPAGN